MHEAPGQDIEAEHDEEPTRGPTRRGFLGGLALLGAGASLAGCSPANSSPANPVRQQPTGAALDRALREKVKTVVVIYAENRSFNNLFADFPGLQSPLAQLSKDAYAQRDRDGVLFDTLPPIFGGTLQVGPQTVDGTTYEKDVAFQTGLPNAPFPLKGPKGEDLPLGLVTRDLWHVFYQNQLQINGGKNDGFAAWSDAGGLTMGYYPQTRYNLRLWDLARQFVLCDNFFQAAFGGSFLNHQYLIAGRAPFYPDAGSSPARSQIAQLQSDDPLDIRLKPLAGSPNKAHDGPPQFGPSAITPDGYTVNTLAPPYWPTWLRDPARPDYSKPDLPNVLVPQTHEHIGDKLAKRNVDWAWYAGAWQATLDAFKDAGSIPKIPNFQYHHQPFNYFAQQGPEHPEERRKRLRDGGLGEDPSTNRFLADAAAGRLPAVTFYKPQGNLNLHAGYADVASGDRHIERIVKTLMESPQWSNMVVVITVDENGGWWDHVAPPQGDRFGPGSRIPALVVSPFARKGTVDHTVYDTTSILRLITRVFDLEALEGLQARDQAMAARGQALLGDLTNALDLG
ncbi:acid phosphatase [Pseudomonas sp. NBRC 111124]|uniref:acid phosphatase n=1 Tax=Pseudomonas sp. NBRC 111124 TaxID=1661039 RepID=UPI000761DA8D|nr:acid phosphatase [Pseudomonas sp. NBRC 111124]